MVKIELPKPMWVLEEVAPLLGRMNGLALHCNFNLGLGGGVLNEGYSHKDLDIICLPRSRKNANRQELLEEMSVILRTELNATEFSVKDLEDGGWSGAALDGRVVYAMRFKVNSEEKRIDWIFVDYQNG